MLNCSCGGKYNILAVSCQRCGHVFEPQMAVIFLIVVILIGAFFFIPFN